VFRILIIGATGVFGTRLAAMLAREPGVQLILAGRTRKTLDALAASLPLLCEIAVIDRDTLSGDDLKGLACQVVIDASGPFQSSHTQVIEAAIVAGVHYADLADGRAFVREIVQFDTRARTADIAVISGASSIPALSHAAIDDITRGWSAYHDICVGIFPGNRAPRGLAVVKSILSYVGKPVRVFRQGAWQSVPGWGMPHRVSVPGVGNRWASVCDTPDQDLLVARYKPIRSAEFFAGLELPILHLGLWLLSLPVRWGLVSSLLPFGGAMLHVAQWCLPFGSDEGGMTIEVSGIDANGAPARLVWALRADSNHGPNVPILATAALARKFRDGQIDFRGAGPCVGMLSFDDFRADLELLGMTINMQRGNETPATPVSPAAFPPRATML
jgi:saccharopine dehydrogenase-like NADP-dependent oxidoreductase